MLSSNWKCYDGNIEIIYFVFYLPFQVNCNQTLDSLLLMPIQVNTDVNTLMSKLLTTLKELGRYHNLRNTSFFTSCPHDNFLMIMGSSPEALWQRLLSKNNFWSGIIKPLFFLLFASQCFCSSRTNLWCKC